MALLPPDSHAGSTCPPEIQAPGDPFVYHDEAETSYVMEHPGIRMLNRGFSFFAFSPLSKGGGTVNFLRLEVLRLEVLRLKVLKL
jgi:hypothetical protein